MPPGLQLICPSESGMKHGLSVDVVGETPGWHFKFRPSYPMDLFMTSFPEGLFKKKKRERKLLQATLSSWANGCFLLILKSAHESKLFPAS